MTPTVLVCGIPTEPPVALVTEALVDAGIPFVCVNQRQAADCEMSIEVAGGAVCGELRVGRATVPLESVGGVYARLMDHRDLPEFRGRAANDPALEHAARLHDVLASWLELTPARVVNRLSAMGSNGSKPYQAQIIARHGFDVPETLITNDPEQVRAFQARGPLIYKSVSGVRSVVRVLGPADMDRLDRIRWCPTQFQLRVEGTDVRVHVVGDTVFATQIETDAVDYRYAGQQGLSSTLHAVDVPPEIAERCVALTRALGLSFSGIDLRRTPDERWCCFEVNPSPGFSYYERNTGQPIAEAVARFLGRDLE